MRHRKVQSRTLGFTSAVLVAAVIWPLGASPRRDPGPTASPADVCAFRLGTIRALFAAANGAGLAGERLRAGDGPATPRPLYTATGALRAELRRVKKSGRVHLGKQGRRGLTKALAAVRRSATKAARAAKRKPASAIELVGDAAARIGSLLAEQIGAYRALACAGGELRVERLHVPDGETRRVPGGAVIVAEEGIELRGDLVMEGTPADGLTLVAERGDIVLEGGVDASGTRLDAAAGLRARAARWSSPRAFTDPNCGDGGSVSITALTGNLVIGARHFAIAGDGTSCPPLIVSDATLTRLRRGTVGNFLAADGGDGGLIQLEAARGTVRFAARLPDEPAPFSPGTGGNGQELLFDPSFVPPPADERSPGVVQFHAGSGGRSGSLQVVAARVNAGGLRHFYRQGEGGRGGDFTWDQRQGSELFPSGVVHLLLLAGEGGPGVVRGGRGGDISYQGDRIVNAVGEPVTSVSVLGGGGGDVYEDPDGTSEPLRPSLLGPDDFLEGGEGGRAEATGHAGWNGTAAFPDGAAGGYINALAGGFLLGGGGSVLPVHPNSRGGRGGDMRLRSGRGGSGWARCDGAALPGGNGGDAGALSARGGKGGDAPGGQGGDGGSVLHAEEGPPGQGGAGTPPGECGALAANDEVHSGESGRGVSMGLLGSVVEVLSNGCNAEPAPCAPTVTTTTLPCGPPFSYHSFVETEDVIRSVTPSGTFVRTTTKTVIEDGTQMCTGSGFSASCVWHRVGSITETIVDPDGEARTTASSYDLEAPDAGQIVQDHCAPDGTPHPIWTPGVDRAERGGNTHTRRHDVSGRIPNANACVAHPFVCCPRYRECPEPAEACWRIAYLTDTFTGCVPP